MTAAKEPLVTVIVLNWNKWQDTIECLSSLSKVFYSNFRIILVDNHSQNNSVAKIQEFLAGQLAEPIDTQFPHLAAQPDLSRLQFMLHEIEQYPYNGTSFKGDKSRHLWLLAAGNLGFARANNLAISLARQVYNPDYYFLLNNDTVIEPNTLLHLVAAMEQDVEIAAAQPVIYHYTNPVKIANAGGIFLPWGQTRYLTKIKPHTVKKIGFVNGCALFLRRDTIIKFGMLSERFFFGEEDFEYSLRLKRQRAKVVCVSDSKIYHKIGASKIAENIERKVVLFAVNRLVDLKQYYKPLIWRFWEVFALYYFRGLLIFKYRTGWHKAKRLITEAKQLADHNWEVDQSTVESIMHKGTE